MSMEMIMMNIVGDSDTGQLFAVNKLGNGFELQEKQYESSNIWTTYSWI
jgi:hypothetical protein